MLSLLTICLLASSVELIAWRLFRQLPTVGKNCMESHDASTGPPGIPNCVYSEKSAEGELTDYRLISRGSRQDAEFGPKSPGTYRIVMVGTSVAAGFRVPQKQTFASLLPVELSRRTGHKVELYNEGMSWRSPKVESGGR